MQTTSVGTPLGLEGHFGHGKCHANGDVAWTQLSITFLGQYLRGNDTKTKTPVSPPGPALP